MLPEYQEGDFVVITRSPFLFRQLSRGDVILFNHDNFGTLIKKIEDILPGGEYFVRGTQENSLDSRKLGYVPRSAVKGKVIWHIRNPKSRL